MTNKRSYKLNKEPDQRVSQTTENLQCIESRIKNQEFLFYQFWAHKGHTTINI